MAMTCALRQLRCGLMSKYGFATLLTRLGGRTTYVVGLGGALKPVNANTP